MFYSNGRKRVVGNKAGGPAFAGDHPVLPPPFVVIWPNGSIHARVCEHLDCILAVVRGLLELRVLLFPAELLAEGGGAVEHPPEATRLALLLVLHSAHVPHGEIVVEAPRLVEQAAHVLDAGHVPARQVLVEGVGALEHIDHAPDRAHVPHSDILVESAICYFGIGGVVGWAVEQGVHAGHL